MVQEIGKRITVVVKDTGETVFLFQWLTTALQSGNAVACFQRMGVDSYGTGDMTPNIVECPPLSIFYPRFRLCSTKLFATTRKSNL